ncbi:calcium uniporter protein, mitochondrial isoform X2 [Desmodus rotundus]|uniref:calcium uniporter protein, mitochondrial isoform X2 n=1 Tax=Desmodus rotundus TaxID=9430 RepID=UPI00238133E0|nr:calcium uniporter protein, mitochondrial isoform X2 [Desmodus rotundus]
MFVNMIMVTDVEGIHLKVQQRLSSWQNLGVVYCSTVVPSDERSFTHRNNALVPPHHHHWHKLAGTEDSSNRPEESLACYQRNVTVVYQNGLPVISVRLPSRRERCQFTLKPISDSVGVFLRQLQEEDRGIDRVAVYSPDGVRVAASTGIDLLLLDDFKLVINDLTYHVRPPKRDLLSHENAATLNDVKTLVQQLYTTLCIEQHQLSKERELIERLEDLREQLAPLEKVRIEISRKAEKRTTLVLWGGLAYMATQFGILARLTWWEYSWDIMEPVTYFITYGSAMAMYAYFVVTRQEYVYPEARDRQYLLFFHKGAKKSRFDLEKYNQLKDAIAQAEMDLKRLRDPLQVHLPLRQIGEKD